MSTDELAYDERLRDLEAAAFRTGRSLARHSEQLAKLREQRRSTYGDAGSLGDASDTQGERTIAARLDATDRRLDAIACVLSALVCRS